MSRESRRTFVKRAGVAAGSGLFFSAGSAAPNAAEPETGQVRFERSIPVARAHDVVVCGGGPSGCAAALAAKREGLTVLLIEGQGQLGGMATSGMVSQWLGGRNQKGEWVVGGLFRSIAEEAASRGYALLPQLDPAKKYHPFGWFNWFIHGVPLDPYGVAGLLDEKMTAAGVDVLLLTQAVDVLTGADRITHVVAFNKSGLSAFPARAVIDATGDADVAARSGCECVKGRREDGLMTPATLEFHVSHVDRERLTSYIEDERDPKLRNKIRELRERGAWPFPYDIFICTQLTQPDTFYVNTVRLVGIDGTDGGSVTDGMIRGREEIEKLVAILREHIPGFEHAQLKAVAPLLGVRETRRIVADWMMTVRDLSEGKAFPDTVGFSMYGWDLPDPKKPSAQPFASDDARQGYRYTVKKGLSTPLPYRIMVPRPIRNLICPGRAVSVERQVLGTVRVMAPCMAMGEASGIAARQVVSGGAGFSQVDVQQLRQRLRQVGAIVDESALPKISPRVDQS
ncbi:MAG TPA: FAD-dependent oxidoreductase [Thermoguttaceae bacterium]|nr:FAD-dependent oxidoreductase [Thermoguttaceae bacterium]